MKTAKEISSDLADLLGICGAQMFSNAVGESSFSSVSRFLSPQRLKSGAELLAAQLLAARASKWAQFDEPNIVMRRSKKGPMDAFTKPREGLRFGNVTPLEGILDDDEGEEVLVVPVAEDSLVEETTTATPTSVPSATTAPTTTNHVTSTTTSTSSAMLVTRHSERPNRGIKMQAIINV